MKKFINTIVFLILSQFLIRGQITGYKVPMVDFSADTTNGIWKIDNSGTQYASYVDTLGSKCLRIQLNSKPTWSGISLNLNKIPVELNLTSSPIIKYDILAVGISPLMTHSYFFDNETKRNSVGAHLERDTITTAIASFHTVTHVFSKPGYLEDETGTGTNINISKIVSILFNYHDKFMWPLTSISGTIYIKNILIGDSAFCSAAKPVVSVKSGAILPCTGGSIVLTTTGGYFSYKWNDGSLSQTATIKSSGSYTVKVFDSNGCQSISDPYVINASQANTPSICAVTVNGITNKNIISWDRPADQKIKRYVIYKEGYPLDKFDSIGTVNYTDFNSFIDENSNANIQANRYRIAAIDSCNTASPMSTIHKTIHLSLNERVGGGINLMWDDYEGLTIPGYIIFRGTDKANMKVYKEISSSNTSYSIIDSLMPYYQVGINLPKNCTSTQLKAEGPVYTQSLSCIVEYKASALAKINSLGAFAYPNPFSENLTISFILEQNSDVLIEVINATGQKTAEFSYKNLAAGNQQIQLSAAAMNITDGMCYLKIVANDKTSVVKCNLVK